MAIKWILKALVQKTISVLPHPEKVNYFFQKYLTKGVILDEEHFKLKIDNARLHSLYYQEYLESDPHQKLLELGTGWYPIVPISFFLQNMGTVYSVDIYKWMTKESILKTIKKFLHWHEEGRLSEYLPQIFENKIQVLKEILESQDILSMKEILSKINLQYLVRDARNLDLDAQSIDFICSNNTLEHISEDVLQGILIEFTRVLKRAGLMCHLIDMSDHFAHFDKQINIFNFLRFSKKQWKLIDNSIQPQNRMRLSDYKNLYSELGIPIKKEIIISSDPGLLKESPIHKEFSGYSSEDLAISHALIVSKYKG